MLGTHPFVRFLNQNRRQIIKTILIIIVFFLILRTLNYMAEQQLQKEEIEEQTQMILEPEHKELIEKFLNFCIKGEDSNAYALLSSENKQQEFKTLNEFKTDYILKYFSTNKKYNITYISKTNEEYYYSVKITEDILSTGKVNLEPVVQNFKVLQENGEDKITINIK